MAAATALNFFSGANKTSGWLDSRKMPNLECLEYLEYYTQSATCNGGVNGLDAEILCSQKILQLPTVEPIVSLSPGRGWNGLSPQSSRLGSVYPKQSITGKGRKMPRQTDPHTAMATTLPSAINVAYYISSIVGSALVVSALACSHHTRIRFG